MTEDEAKTKWCPASFGASAVPAGNAGGGSYGGAAGGGPSSPRTHCIGSACMAWRWIGVSHEVREQARDVMRIELPVKYSGYCGLAGKL